MIRAHLPIEGLTVRGSFVDLTPGAPVRMGLKGPQVGEVVGIEFTDDGVDLVFSITNPTVMAGLRGSNDDLSHLTISDVDVESMRRKPRG